MALPFEEQFDGSIRWYEVYNNTSETIPPRSVVKVTGLNTSNGVTRPALLAGKPDGVGSQGQHMVTGPVPIGQGKYGRACKEGLCLCAYSAADGTPSVSTAWGPNNNEWVLRKRIGGYRIRALSTQGQTIGVAVVELAPWTIAYGTLDGDLAHAGSATVSVYDSTGDTTFNLTVYDHSKIGTGKEIVTGSRIDFGWMELDQRWALLGSAVCPTTA